MARNSKLLSARISAVGFPLRIEKSEFFTNHFYFEAISLDKRAVFSIFYGSRLAKPHESEKKTSSGMNAHGKILVRRPGTRGFCLMITKPFQRLIFILLEIEDLFCDKGLSKERKIKVDQEGTNSENGQVAEIRRGNWVENTFTR